MKSEIISAEPVTPPEETPATPESAPQTPVTEEPEEETPEGDPAPDPAPAEAAAAVPAPKMTAFQRGALRALGIGELVHRVEAAEMTAAVLQAGNVTLAAENTRLVSRIAQLEAELPRQVEAAAKGRENQVAREVAAELQGLGISAAAAPAQSADDGGKIKTRAEFSELSVKARGEFIKNGGKLTD